MKTRTRFWMLGIPGQPGRRWPAARWRVRPTSMPQPPASPSFVTLVLAFVAFVLAFLTLVFTLVAELVRRQPGLVSALADRASKGARDRPGEPVPRAGAEWFVRRWQPRKSLRKPEPVRRAAERWKPHGESRAAGRADEQRQPVAGFYRRQLRKCAAPARDRCPVRWRTGAGVNRRVSRAVDSRRVNPLVSHLGSRAAVRPPPRADRLRRVLPRAASRKVAAPLRVSSRRAALRPAGSHRAASRRVAAPLRVGSRREPFVQRASGGSAGWQHLFRWAVFRQPIIRWAATGGQPHGWWFHAIDWRGGIRRFRSDSDRRAGASWWHSSSGRRAAGHGRPGRRGNAWYWRANRWCSRRGCTGFPDAERRCESVGWWFTFGSGLATIGPGIDRGLPAGRGDSSGRRRCTQQILRRKAPARHFRRRCSGLTGSNGRGRTGRWPDDYRGQARTDRPAL